MLICVSLLLVFIALAQSAPTFDEWSQKWNKTFSSTEYNYRQSIYQENLKFIQNHDSPDFSLAINGFAHLTLDEFKKLHTGLVRPHKSMTYSSQVMLLPEAVDWVKAGAVTHVKNQGNCGSCWAFSATGSMEAAWFFSHQRLISLSAQQLVDCAKNDGNEGCNGGNMDAAFEWVIQHHGICNESSYRYTGRDGVCRKCKPAVMITNWTAVHPNDETSLLQALSQQPVSVAVEADTRWQFYSGGILTSSCGSNVDHGVLAVGYATDNITGTPFWRIKNSWGTTWGEHGYIRIARGTQYNPAGQCGILTEPMFAK